MTPKSCDLYSLYAVHLEWLGVRSELPTGERREFIRWICRTHPECIPPHSELAKFRMICQNVQRQGKVPTTPKIGEATIRRYAEALSRKYRALAIPIPFQTFLNNTLTECQTEQSLRRSLREYLP